MMKSPWATIVAVSVGVGIFGCARVQTRLVEMPRVDQEVQGNRGYLEGSGPSARPARKTTRQVLMTDVELSTGREVGQGLKRRFHIGAPVKGQVGPGGRGYVVPEELEPTAPPAVTTSGVQPIRRLSPSPAVFEELPPVEPVTPRTIEPAPALSPSSYTVQKGDTLEKIAKEVYGDPKRWPSLYEANRGILKSPNHVYPGQVLTIPSDTRTHRESEASRASELK